MTWDPCDDYDDEGPDFESDRAGACIRARQWMAKYPLFLDTETTGLERSDEICDIAIVDARGNVVLNSLVKPTKSIPPCATQVHGICDEDVVGAPSFLDLLPALDRILCSRTVVIYNRDFDRSMLRQSADAHGVSILDYKFAQFVWFDPVHYPTQSSAPPISRQRTQDYLKWLQEGYLWHCAMEGYAAFYGEWSSYHGNYKWQSLSRAAHQCGIKLPPDLHRARADADLCRRVVLQVARGDGR